MVRRAQVGTGHHDIWTRLWPTPTKGDPVKAIGTSGATIILALVLRRLARAYRLPQSDMLTALHHNLGCSLFIRPDLAWTQRQYFDRHGRVGACKPAGAAVAGFQVGLHCL